MSFEVKITPKKGNKKAARLSVYVKFYAMVMRPLSANHSCPASSALQITPRHDFPCGAVFVPFQGTKKACLATGLENHGGDYTNWQQTLLLKIFYAKQ